MYLLPLHCTLKNEENDTFYVAWILLQFSKSVQFAEFSQAEHACAATTQVKNSVTYPPGVILL